MEPGDLDIREGVNKMSTVAFFALVAALFQLKHFLSDYPLQTPWMLGKFKDVGWVKPLAAHCAVHAVFTFTISVILTGNVLLSMGVALLDSSLHFVMDRVKASPKLLGRYEALTKADFKAHAAKMERLNKEMYDLTLFQDSLEYAAEKQTQINDENVEWLAKLKSNTYFWWSLGVDQTFHHLTDLGVAFIIVQSMM